MNCFHFICRVCRTYVVLAVLLASMVGETPGSEFVSRWPARIERTWIGAEFWANRLQDWQLRGGRVECTGTRLPMRTLHLLTHRLDSLQQPVSFTVRLGRFDPVAQHAPDAAAGLLLGAGAASLDYRAAALVQSSAGPDGGIFCGIDGHGHLFVRDNTRRGGPPIARSDDTADDRDVLLHVDLAADADDPEMATLTVTASDPATNGLVLSLSSIKVPRAILEGNVALVSHTGSQRNGRYWFRDWRAGGDSLAYHPQRTAGPILASQYTLSERVVKMTAQMMPIGAAESQVVVLQVNRGGKWQEVGRGKVEFPSYTAHFRLADWDDSVDVPYRLIYELTTGEGKQDAVWFGLIRRNPSDKQVLVIAGFTGNHNNRHGFGRAGYPWNENGLWFPHSDIARAVKVQNPDVLFFSGDQVYEGDSPTYADRSGYTSSYLDYLYKWYLWCWAWGDLARDRPCLSIPDDHDVYQGNLWGQGGRKSPGKDHDGGYVLPADFVRMVERTQTSHLPDPFDPTPVEQGIGVYYCPMTYGGVSFAVIEDRKFKSGCARPDMPPSGTGRPDHFNDPTFDTKRLDIAGVQLLGKRQLKFLETWAEDWHDAEMKIALSQTMFANLATHHGGNLQRLMADLDSNGWPQSGRNRALRALRKGFAFHLAGDQHLATIVHHGIDRHDDAIWAFCVPSIANFYPRAFAPLQTGPYHWPMPDEFRGPRRDGFGNLITVLAATNPGPDMGHEPRALHNKMPGYGIVRMDKAQRTITMECWPRFVDPSAKDAKQYDGWPRTVSQMDNYGATPFGYLPRLRIVQGSSPVVQVRSEPDSQVVYTIRIVGDTFDPPVFAPGSYSVQVGARQDADSQKVGGLQPAPEKGSGELTIRMAR